MNFAGIVHQPKSRYSYIYEKNKLHLRIKTQKGQVKNIKVHAVDPFNWIRTHDRNHEFDIDSIKTFDMVFEGEAKDYDVWFCEVSGIETLRIRYCFEIFACDENRYFYGCNGGNVLQKDDLEQNNAFLHTTSEYFNFPFLNEEDMYVSPSWVKNAVWYQLTPTVYSNNGEEAKSNTDGNFAGLTKKIDYIQDMGYTAIYMTPIFDGFSWHLYDTTDYFKVSPKLGGNEEFKKFVEEAHKRNIRVMIDAVFNHCGSLFEFWRDVLKNGKSSKYYDCFYIIDENRPILNCEIMEDGSYSDKGGYHNNFRTFAYTTKMPKLNTNNPIMREYLMKVAKYWVEEFEVDGWRLDVSNEVSHDFWREFRKNVKGVNKDTFIMGENWDDAYPWLMGDQFDSVMNYGFMNLALNFISPKISKKFDKLATNFKNEFIELSTKYPKHLTENLFNFVCSHDVDRLMTTCEGNENLVKIAYLLLLTYSGTPCIYYGDEVGMEGKEPINRSPMIWDESKQNLVLKNHIKKLIAIRKENPCLKSLNTSWILADDNSNTVIFERYDASDKVYVLVHNSNESHKVKVPSELVGKIFKDVYTCDKIVFEDYIELEAYKFIIFKP